MDGPRGVRGLDHCCPATAYGLTRTALASCAVTHIATEAASRGIALQTLEAHAASRSGLRRLVGVAEADGRRVPAGPLAMDLHVRIGAPGVDAALLRALM